MHESGFDTKWQAMRYFEEERTRNIDDWATAQRKRNNIPSPEIEDEEDQDTDPDKEDDPEGQQSTVEEEITLQRLSA